VSHPLVVNLRRAHFDVYIGRGRGSPWGNPFSWKPCTLATFLCTKEECLAKYEAWLRAQPDLVARARRELRGKVLGCFCAPADCHGDVLARVAAEDG
jgi:hypothetical protein